MPARSRSGGLHKGNLFDTNVPATSIDKDIFTEQEVEDTIAGDDLILMLDVSETPDKIKYMTRTNFVDGLVGDNITVTDNESTNENDLIPFVADAATTTGTQELEMDGDFHYNPSTGRLTATQLAGTLQTASQTNITSVGTIGTGTWEATDVGVAHGGTGVSTLLSNAILTGNGASAIQAETDLLFSSNKLIPTSSAHDAAGTILTVSAGAPTAGTSNNQAGGALTFQGGQGKGSGAGGAIIFQVANESGSGSSLNSLVTALTINDDGTLTTVGAIELGNSGDTTIARSGSGDITIEGNAVYRAGGTDVAVADGGTGASSLNNLITLATHTTGDYVQNITGGVGIDSNGATSGENIAHSLTLDLSELTDTAIANGDYIVFTDATDSHASVKGDLADVATLFAGTGLTASSSVIGVDASQTQITSVGTIGTGVWQGTAIASSYIAADAITGAKIADNAIDSEHYTDGSIDNAHIADDAIDSEHYADGSIDNAHIADDAIDSEHYADGSIDTAHIADNQITLAKMASGTDGNIISYDASGDPVAIATGSDGQVLTSAGAGAPPAFETPTVGDITAVTAGVGLSGGGTAGALSIALDLSELSTVTPADGDFFSTLDSDGANEQKTTTTALATLLAGTGLTASSSVIGVDAAQTQITSVGTIGTGVWQGTAIASGYIAADAITGAKIADNAIDSEHYTDGSIDNAHIADNAIDSEHYADGSIDNAHIADDAIDSEHYAAGSIDTAHLAADVITGAKIADDAVDSEHYTDGSIDTAHIADNQITLAKMAGGTDGNIISYDASGDPVAIATGSDGQVLTSTGAGSPPAFETPTVGDITGVTAGVGLSGGGSSGAVTLTLDLSELSTVTPADGDFFSTLDSDGANEQKTTTTALATLFAGTGLTASSSVIGVDASQGQITTVGALDAGSITSGFTSIDVGAGAIAGGSFDASDGNITNVGDIALDSISADATDINIAVTDNSATALTVLQGSDAYLIIDTANSSESVSIGTGISGTAIAIGHGTSEVTFGDNVTITGDLTINGAQVTNATTNLTVADPLVKYGQAYVGSAYDQGFIVTRGDGSSSNTQNMAFIWDESADEFSTIKAATEDGTTAGNVTVTDYVNLHVGAITADDTSVFSGSIELGHATDTTIARASSGDVNIEGNIIYRAGGTDVPVADGGTGASTLTDGGVLLGSGTGAITAMAVLADGEMIVGDGTADPVAESGATLRTSIGAASPGFSVAMAIAL